MSEQLVDADFETRLFSLDYQNAHLLCSLRDISVSLGDEKRLSLIFGDCFLFPGLAFFRPLSWESICLRNRASFLL